MSLKITRPLFSYDALLWWLFSNWLIWIIRFIVIFGIIVKVLVTIIVCVIFKWFIFAVILNNFFTVWRSNDVETSSLKSVLVSPRMESIFLYHSGLLFGAKPLAFRRWSLISHNFRLIILYFAWSFFVYSCKGSCFPLPKSFALHWRNSSLFFPLEKGVISHNQLLH